MNGSRELGKIRRIWMGDNSRRSKRERGRGGGRKMRRREAGSFSRSGMHGAAHPR